MDNLNAQNYNQPPVSPQVPPAAPPPPVPPVVPPQSSAPLPRPQTPFHHSFNILSMNKKIILIGVGIVVLVGMVLVGRVLISSYSNRSALPLKVIGSQNQGAKITLTSAKNSYKVGETIPVVVTADTAGHQITGADLIVQYDPKFVQVSQADLSKGQMFSEYPLMSVDANSNTISISGISNVQNGFTGIGQFAMINFKAKAAGKTALLISFKKGQTTDSNLVDMDTAQNIIEEVENLEVSIQ